MGVRDMGHFFRRRAPLFLCTGVGVRDIGPSTDPSKDRLGPPLAFLGVLLAPIGDLWVPSGSFWAPLGCLLALLGHPLSALWSFMGIFWASLAPLGRLGALVLGMLGHVC